MPCKGTPFSGFESYLKLAGHRSKMQTGAMLSSLSARLGHGAPWRCLQLSSSSQQRRCCSIPKLTLHSSHSRAHRSLSPHTLTKKGERMGPWAQRVQRTPQRGAQLAGMRCSRWITLGSNFMRIVVLGLLWSLTGTKCAVTLRQQTSGAGGPASRLRRRRRCRANTCAAKLKSPRGLNCL